MEHNSLISNLLSFVEDEDELRDSVKGINECVNKTFQVCWNTCNNLNEKTSLVFEIESVLDYLYDELNTGHWSEVPLKVRKAFTAASFAKTIIILKTTMTCTHCIIEECLKTLDMGILLGAPLENNSDVLTNCATFLSKQLNNTPNCESTQKIETTMKVKSRSQYFDNFENLKGVTVDTLSCPSLETFNNKYFCKKVPLKLQDCVSHWPALTKWPDVNYLLKIAGDRTVPVEIGSHYADENWRQKLMTLKDFIKNYFLGESDSIGYLAQHNLFNQIPELREDIYVPEYCSLSDMDEDGEPDVNAWFGPANTVSPLHHDPKNNVLVQVFGTKQLILYAPSDSSYLYPHESNLLSNTAQVDPFKPDAEKYPNFAKANAYKCILEPGEMLYIPPKWWHHVTALDKSFSVSFWWN